MNTTYSTEHLDRTIIKITRQVNKLYSMLYGAVKKTDKRKDHLRQNRQKRTIKESKE
jgi:hypothetical protein